MGVLKSIRTWKKISQPKGSVLFWQFITALFPVIIEIILAVPAARLISSLSVFDYNTAKLNLIYCLGLIFLCFILWNINYILYPKQIKHIYTNIHNNIFNKILSTDNQSFKQNSKEKMINILSTNMLSMTEFTNLLSKKFAYLFASIIMLIIIFYYSYIIGLIVLFISLLAYLFYLIVNKQLANRTNDIQNSRDVLLENFGDVVDGRNVSNDLNLVEKLKNKYISSVNNISYSYKKEHILKLFAEKWIYYFWKILVNVLTFYLITLVESNNFSLTIYLILTPYLSSTIQHLFNFLSVLTDLNLAKVSALRIKTILDMSDKDMIDFGKNTTNEIDGAITFTNVSYTQEKNSNNIFGNIKTFSLHIPKGRFTFFQGIKNCGKRAIFYMLRREIRPTTGTITFDTVNIYDFDKDTYSKNMSYVNKKPYFFNDSIINNLKYINPNTKIIKATLQELFIMEDILKLEDGLNTNIFKNRDYVSTYLLFMIGLARAILTNSEIISIYELPIGLTQREIQTIERVLKKLKKSRTILFFSATDYFSNLVDIHCSVVDGTIKKLSEE